MTADEAMARLWRERARRYRDLLALEEDGSELAVLYKAAADEFEFSAEELEG